MCDVVEDEMQRNFYISDANNEKLYVEKYFRYI